MNENLVRQAHEMLDAANHARIPADRPGVRRGEPQQEPWGV